jgi:hypothetical protein
MMKAVLLTRLQHLSADRTGSLLSPPHLAKQKAQTLDLAPSATPAQWQHHFAADQLPPSGLRIGVAAALALDQKPSKTVIRGLQKWLLPTQSRHSSREY